MAIFHLSVKTVSRSAGRSATAAAAYRAGVSIIDQRTGEVHDYTRKGGVVSASLILPDGAPEWAADRGELWNAAELAETRKNSTVAREFEIALPGELTSEQRAELAHDFAREIVTRHGCAADVAIHEPGKGGDQRNHHAHILLTTRRVGADGVGEKTRELDDRKEGRALVLEWRERFADLTNERLQAAGHAVRVDHRSLEDQGIEREPTQHLGPTATAIERRTGQPSRKRLEWDQSAQERLERAAAAGQAERERELIDLSGRLQDAIKERDAAAAWVEALEKHKRDHAQMQAQRADVVRQELEEAKARGSAAARPQLQAVSLDDLIGPGASKAAAERQEREREAEKQRIEDERRKAEREERQRKDREQWEALIGTPTAEQKQAREERERAKLAEVWERQEREWARQREEAKAREPVPTPAPTPSPTLTPEPARESRPAEPKQVQERQEAERKKAEQEKAKGKGWSR